MTERTQKPPRHLFFSLLIQLRWLTIAAIATVILTAIASWHAVTASASTLPAQMAPVSATDSAQTAGTEAIITALLNTPISRAELPRGYTVARIADTSTTLTTTQARFGAAGRVSVAINGPDDDNGFEYIVFPTENAAQRFFSVLAGYDDAYSVPDALFPTVCYSSGGTRNGQSYGDTECRMIISNVVVGGWSTIAGNHTWGDDGNAQAMAQAGLNHLATAVGSNSKY